MKYFIAILIALSLTACATQQSATPLMGATPPSRGSQAFATLAPLGSFEWRAAPYYTRNAALRHRAAALLDARRISVADARDLLNRTNSVRGLLDAAVAMDVRGNTDGAAGALGDAGRWLDEAEALLKGK